MKVFIGPVLISVAAFVATFVMGGMAALLLVLFLTILEVSLSFDNAVVNAKVLMHMDEVWRRRFLTWGMLIAVFGARLVLPILLVSLAVTISPVALVALIFESPAEYAHLVEQAAPIIHSLGGAFLAMVALKYFFDEAKRVHWIPLVEQRFATWGRIHAIEVAIVLVILLLTTLAVPAHASQILGAGSIGIVLFILMEGVVDMLGSTTGELAKQGFGLFMYLNLLDAAFSFDGVIGAFALTTDLLVIVVGLGLGAYFVRAFTVLLVERKTLATLVYLEHGAYWAIAALAFCMFAALFHPVPDAVAGTVSLLFIGAAYLSSLHTRRKNPSVTGS
jgi:hypothetical protein